MSTIETLTGLSNEAAELLLKQYGPNELPSERKRWRNVLLSVLREPMLALLLATAITYLIIGDAVEAWMLLSSCLLIIAINFVQHVRSERALQALKNLSSPRAIVIRSGVRVHIHSREIVPGDLMILDEGDRISADAQIVQSLNLLVNESLLTGESIPIAKQQNQMLYSGSLVVSGSAVVNVIATGERTEIGKIGIALSTIETENTPLEIQTTKLVWWLASLGIGCSLLIAFAVYLQRGGAIEAILIGLALAMSLLPEEIPVVLTTFLALGARRLSSYGILVRKMSAVEALGTITTLCVDKTGTLTKNEIELLEVYTPEDGITHVLDAPTDASMKLLQTAIDSSREMSFDPMDTAIFTAASRSGLGASLGTLALQIPLSHDLPALTQVWQRHARFEVAVKGAPEAVLNLAHPSEEIQMKVKKALEVFTQRGLRVLGVARANVVDLSLSITAYPLEFVGLLAFADPIRAGIDNAMRQCNSAGIRVIMLTGDHPNTAQAIATQAGIKHPEIVMIGSYLTESPSPAAIAASNVYARIVPMQKLLIVRALQSSGEVVAMTGDGVNDAPALRAANIGVAMGRRGTDVAREAADIVLTQDDFPSLVTAIRLGRLTYDNIKKAMYYIVAMHIPIAGLAFLPIVLGHPLILLPVHIVLLELLLDPMSTLIFESEAEEENVMLRQPRIPKEPIFQKTRLLIAGLQGFGVLAACSAIYLFFFTTSQQEARTLTFVTLMISNICLALVNRSQTKTFWQTISVANKMLWIVVIAGVLFLIAVTEISFLSVLFGFSVFHFHDWVICSSAAAFSVTWFELLKLSGKKHSRL